MIGHRLRQCYPLLFFVAIGLLAPGCSGSDDSLPREAVSGIVTMDGQPLANGAIRFTPAGDAGTSGIAQPGGSPIVAGKFSIDQEHGLVPGKYKVAVNAAGGKAGGAAGKTAEPGRPSRTDRPTELVPTKYNAESTLESEIKKGGSNHIEFKLESK